MSSPSPTRTCHRPGARILRTSARRARGPPRAYPPELSTRNSDHVPISCPGNEGFAMFKLGSVCTSLVVVLITTGLSSADPTQIIVRFSPGEVASPAGVKRGAVNRFSFQRQELSQALKSEGVEELTRLFPDFRSEDRVSTNLAGEKILLEDLSTYFLVSFRPGTERDGSRRLGRIRGVETAHPSAPRVLTSDPLFFKQWWLHNEGPTQPVCPGNTHPSLVSGKDIHGPEAWAITTGSPNVRVGILDTGIQADHEDLTPRVNLSDGKTFSQACSGPPPYTCPDPPPCDYDGPELPNDTAGQGS